MELHDYIRILRKNWLILLVCVILGGSAGAAYSLVSKPTYESTTQMYVSVRFEGAASDLLQGTNYARQIITSYVAVARTAVVLDPVIEELGLDVTSPELARQISAEAPANTVMLYLTASASDPELAADIANAAAASLSDAVQNSLEAQGESGSAVNVRVVQPAVVPSSPAGPSLLVWIAVGVAAGLILGVIVSALRTILDTRIHTLHDIESITDAPILGGIAFDPDAPKRPLVVHADPRSPRAESFRALRTNLQFLATGDESRIFVISSAGPGEGKSTTSTNLAITLAETGARVVLIDGDLRLPRVADYLGIEGGVGVTDVLIGRVALADALQPWGRGNMSVLTSGPIPPNPSELLGSRAMDNVLAQLGASFDYVIIDAPPLLLVTDAAVLGRKARGIILAAASGRTKKQQFAGAVKAAQTAAATVLGVVPTMLPTRGPDSYSYGNYTYGSTQPTTETRATLRKSATSAKQPAPKGSRRRPTPQRQR
ncbi:polysaccharide biosynthesis tyrosine autokinase [Microbacterium dauci]|uniref:Polysaccharide biosynthesis tyrosine autokinase n=1 Tax=Microbacterium dauci TaxID=3048008 RepID=A0ABT6ZEB9_9MICO|nr:polysaccharide biosynthesis tyrosine autokinase [Microbacterium sp. LX3-4]MDJ1114499.1 polysaccharide biosynthesis tyrosine autokinase [Microbacterium sp. LX3-4]